MNAMQKLTEIKPQKRHILDLNRNSSIKLIIIFDKEMGRSFVSGSNLSESVETKHASCSYKIVSKHCTYLNRDNQAMPGVQSHLG